MSSCVQAPFHRCSRWGWWRRPCWRARHSSRSWGSTSGCCCSTVASVSLMNWGIVCWRSVSRGSFRAGHGHSQIQCRSESVAIQRGQCAFFALAWGSSVYREYREPSTFHPVMSFMMVDRLAWECCGSFHICLSMVRERPPMCRLRAR